MVTPANDAAVFVTVNEAARILAVSERTARRIAARLPDTDRQKPDTRLDTCRTCATDPLPTRCSESGNRSFIRGE